MAWTKIGIIQVIQRDGIGYEERTERLYRQARACLEEGAELVFFPEAYQHVPDRDIVFDPDRLLKVSGEWKERCAALAREFSAYVVPWDYEYRDGRTYNSSYILDRNGVEIGRYRKVHLTRSEQDGRKLTGGDGFPVFDLDIGRIGIMICWDNYFPESARCLYNNGAELVLYPLYGDTLNPGWETKLRARAADNFMYIACSQIDIRQGVYSGLVSPEGEVLCRLEQGRECHAVVEIDIGREVVAHTNGNPAYPERLRDYVERCRRPDAYGAIMKAPEINSWEDIYFGNPIPLAKGKEKK